jgi:predicted neuraminidase
MPVVLSRYVSRSFALRLGVALVFCAAVMGWDMAHRGPGNLSAKAVWPRVTVDFSQPLKVLGQGYIPMPPDTPAAHSSSLLPMPASYPDALLAFWFAGTKESAPDIGIAVSGFDRATQQWRAARFVVNRHALGQQLGFGVRRLGNPVAWLDAQGRVHLFVVATGLGGWAASRIVQLRQSQPGQALETMSFEVLRVLPLSWWWNTSFLVRTAPLPLQDGGMVLPAYFELGLKYPVALRFDGGGDFKGMVRMSARTYMLQPAWAALEESSWLALMRDQRPGGKVTAAQTRDGGQHWQDLSDLHLVNPDASVAALALAPGQLWLVHNSSLHSRNVLDLSYSVDGQSWQLVQRLAQGSGTDEYSYPAMAWADDSLWVSYTDQRKRIAWQRFAWPTR